MLWPRTATAAQLLTVVALVLMSLSLMAAAVFLNRMTGEINDLSDRVDGIVDVCEIGDSP